MKTTFRWLGALALTLQLCGCGALLKTASHADDVAKVGKASGAAVDAGQVAVKSDEVANVAVRAGDEAAQTGEVAVQTAEQAAHNGEAVAQTAEVVGHGADILSLAYDTFEDSAEEDDNWEADEQADLERATAELKKASLALQSLPPEAKKQMADEVGALERQVQKSAQSKKLEDMRAAGKLGTELVYKVNAIRTGATIEP